MLLWPLVTRTETWAFYIVGENGSTSQHLEPETEEGDICTILSLLVERLIIDASRMPPSFLATKKKLEVAGDVEGSL